MQADVVALGGELGKSLQLERQLEATVRELAAALEQQRLVLLRHESDLQRQQRRRNSGAENEEENENENDEDKTLSSSTRASGGALALAQISSKIISVGGSTSSSSSSSGGGSGSGSGGGGGGRDFSEENPMLVLVQHRIEQLTALCRGLSEYAHRPALDGGALDARFDAVTTQVQGDIDISILFRIGLSLYS